ncbi:TonB-dependent receptor [Phenylobacterium sp.]|jgi:iron complex outermembrane receptor protein|uniref:TonB-dependent receptor plug domain-containing protein n=1 Tax=Phenylobacterium sp. TaxID=1871053 RepID=UPI000C9363CD|nr:TonB-dependent receptor [Phenylobacterium sp.]MAK83731.1 TonB-dependent receptor [Phenylobacterium sp.]|tara:strand:+ start:11058 stop:13451 length:2394 start_codon:yes stop_codon:yes gene_type:complete
MHYSGLKRRLYATVAITMAIGALGGQARADEAATVDELIVTGTREVGRTQFTTLAPVDVLSEEMIQASATAQLGENLAQQIPSFIVQRLPTSDGLQFVRPATLRSLSPDQTLVLVNGKRFHRSAFLGARGAQAADLAQIPSYAVKRIEVLRDGASAQYGSDAIAGVINVILNDQPGVRGFAQAGQFAEGDGVTYRAGVQAGVEIGSANFNLTAEWSDAEATSRTRQRQDAIAFQAANPTLKVPNPVQRWGNPDLETRAVGLNTVVDTGEAGEFYGFVTYTETEGVNDINWRNPATNPGIYRTTAAFPGFDLRSIYPAGFTPIEGVESEDYQTLAGFRDVVGDFTWDLSASYGRNDTAFFLKNTINASLGPNSPTAFDLGRLVQSEFNLNADAVYRMNVAALAAPLNIAFGAERRVETYAIRAGDPESYAVGPGAAFGLAPSSNGFPGFSDIQAGEWQQQSYAAYVDVEAQLTEAWSLGGALRYEDFSEFGDTLNGKIATRYAITDNLALRGAWSSGFRAPTPGQLNSTSTSQGLDTVTLQLFTSGRLSPTNPVAVFLGAEPLEPETSETVTAGLTWRTDYGFSGSIDAYQIDVSDRFSSSASVTVTPAIRAQLVAAGVPGASAFTRINWFANDFDTRTRGVDVVGAYDRDLGPGRLNLTAAYNYNQTEVTAGSIAANPTQQRLFEESRPQHNATASATYGFGPFEVLGRMRYYGSWTDSTGNATGDIFQDFGAMTFFDLAVTYAPSEFVSIRVGAENVFDSYPDEAVFQASRGLVYSRNSPYDTNGAMYYLRLETSF